MIPVLLWALWVSTEVAFERSYFQCIAILMAALVSKVPS
jgi:hypothetical protein